jgi:HNH endonuclease
VSRQYPTGAQHGNYREVMLHACVICQTTIPRGQLSPWNYIRQLTCSNACGHEKKSRAKRAALANRFWRQVDQRGPDECWPWLGACNQARYGVIRVYPQRNVLAHRLALELTTGTSVPSGLEVCHSCDNPPCCNSAHLWAGTHKENMHDSIRKGRGTYFHRT